MFKTLSSIQSQKTKYKVFFIFAHFIFSTVLIIDSVKTCLPLLIKHNSYIFSIKSSKLAVSSNFFIITLKLKSPDNK